MGLGALAHVVMIVFLLSVMLSVGLETTGRAILAAGRNTRFLARALVANLVVVPLLGVLIARAFPLPRGLAIALLLLAGAPGAPLSVGFTTRVREDLPLAAALHLILTAAAIVVSPLLFWFMLPAQAHVTLPVAPILRYVLLLLALPLVAGRLIQARAPAAAAWLRRPTRVVAALTLPAFILATLGARREATRAIGGTAIVAVLVLILLGLLAGWLAGGPRRGTRQIVACATSMRNTALCLLLAVQAYPGQGVDVGVAAFSALMVPPSMLLSLFEGRRRKRLAAAAPAAPAPA
ncbi:MAG TPA: bile acid:sodium symporter [Polyangia bacterium]|jgi:BASS family bile acid:Na+ symporter